MEVLSRCGISGIEAFIFQAQLRWVGHVHRMPDRRIPKAVFYSELASGSRTLDRPLQRYRDKMKANMQSAGIDPRNWETLACNRSKWHEVCHSGVQHFEENRVAVEVEKRRRR